MKTETKKYERNADLLLTHTHTHMQEGNTKTTSFKTGGRSGTDREKATGTDKQTHTQRSLFSGVQRISETCMQHSSLGVFDKSKPLQDMQSSIHSVSFLVKFRQRILLTLQ